MSFEKLTVGLTSTKTYKVEKEHIANFLGSGAVAVLSTPSMILFMENTARLLAQEHLTDPWTTVGTHVDIYHLKPANVGSTVAVTATLQKVDNKKLTFSVLATCNNEKIGEGIHDRYIVNKEKFMSKK